MRCMLIGAVGSGKTTLSRAIEGLEPESVKTQTVTYNARTIDTPGEYTENPRLYRAILATATEAECILFVQDATADRTHFPPAMGQAFPSISIGVVSKIDHPGADVVRARSLLQSVGLRGPTFEVSALVGTGIDRLLAFLGEPEPGAATVVASDSGNTAGGRAR